MPPDEFAEALREELARRGGHFDPDDVARFVLSAWPRIAADPDPARWRSWRCWTKFRWPSTSTSSRQSRSLTPRRATTRVAS